MRLAETRPRFRIQIIEAAGTLCGNHTWSFFASDLTDIQAARLDPLVAFRWTGYEVRFRDRYKRLTTGYRSITSDALRTATEQRLAGAVKFNAPVVTATDDHVVLQGGAKLTAPCVIDARGGRTTPNLAVGYQKFLGQEVQLDVPHGLRVPLLMDATVEQLDGFRFVYTLPLDPCRLLIEDTYYSSGAELPVEQLRSRIADYAATKGWRVRSQIREERGVLPIILAGDHERLAAEGAGGAPRIGLAAALSHPTTGYSLPDAVRVADLLAEKLAANGALASRDVRSVIDRYSRSIWRERSFYRLLNRMLFQAAEPQNRHGVLARFYALNQPLIERFYAGSLTGEDKVRIVLHMLIKPPVPMLSALGCIPEGRTFRALSRG